MVRVVERPAAAHDRLGGFAGEELLGRGRRDPLELREISQEHLKNARKRGEMHRNPTPNCQKPREKPMKTKGNPPKPVEKAWKTFRGAASSSWAVLAPRSSTGGSSELQETMTQCGPARSGMQKRPKGAAEATMASGSAEESSESKETGRTSMKCMENLTKNDENDEKTVEN